MADDDRARRAGTVWWRLRRKVGRPVRWWRAERRRRAPAPRGNALYVYGHSFVAGHGIEPWPSAVAEELGLPLVNLGRSGDLVHQTLRLARPHGGRPHAGDIVLVEVGINDVRRHGDDRAWLARFERTLDQIAARLSAHGAAVRLLADPPLLDWTSAASDAGRGSDEGWAEYHAAVMSRPGAIDLAAGWDRHTMICPDLVHPNEAGVAALAAAVLAGLAAQGDHGPARPS
jgi:lysophospholipase L1-like esterase